MWKVERWLSRREHIDLPFLGFSGIRVWFVHSPLTLACTHSSNYRLRTVRSSAFASRWSFRRGFLRFRLTLNVCLRRGFSLLCGFLFLLFCLGLRVIDHDYVVDSFCLPF